MPDSSWDNYTPDSPRWRIGGRLLTGLGIGILLLVLFVSTLALVARNTRSNAWPLLMHVTSQLATDERARDLYRHNPALATTYPTEEAFLDRVREHREGLKLAAAEPAPGPGHRVGSGPFGLRVRHHCEAGTWMEVGVEFSAPFRPVAAGEGIYRLNLAKEARDLRRLAQAAVERRSAQEWKRFVETCQGLVKNGGPESLKREFPTLRTVPADDAAFAALVQRRRDGLLALDPQVQGAFNRRSHRGPFSQTLEIDAGLSDGGSIRIAWKSDAVVAVELR